MAAPYLLGMDCGTTNIKAVLMGGDGVVAEASRPNRFISPGPGMQEQDARQWWRSVTEIFRDLRNRADGAMANLKGICISSHTVSLLPLDERGEPLRNALTYQDTRSAGELQEILDTVGRERFISIVGGQPSVAFLPNKLLWYRRNEPELYARTACFLQASSYIVYKLTGRRTTDIDQASRTQCMDITTMKWSREIAAATGVDLDALLPKPRPVDEIVGTVAAEAAAETGLPEGVPVMAGCSDAMASMYAAGLNRLGEAAESSGTTSLVFVGSKKQSLPDVPVVTRPCAIGGMPWIFDAPIQASGAAIRWFIDTLGAQERAEAEAAGKDIYTYLNELALTAGPGAGGLIFFPYLLGERAPLWNDYARGMFIGLSMTTSRAELVRSVFEGTAFALRHVIETVRESGGEARMLRVCGGGAKSRTWAMIKASALHMPVCLLDDASGDVPVGDALIAGHKVGVFPDLTEAVNRIVKVKEVIDPIPEWEAAYDKLYPYYIEMYQHLDADLKSLKSVADNL